MDAEKLANTAALVRAGAEPFSITRVFVWREEECLARVVPGMRTSFAAREALEGEGPHWFLERANGETYIGPDYLPGEENPPGWSGTVARFGEVLDREV